MKAWAIVVAGMGSSTFDKLRADLPKVYAQRLALVGATGCPLQVGPDAPSLIFTSGSTGAQRGCVGAEEKARMLRAYVRELLGTLNFNPEPA